jgi:P27 family predicted phage terminase small subunit
MGRHGPPKKPTALRILHGDEERRINRAEPQPANGVPLAPDSLSPAGRAIWDYIVPELDHMNLAKLPDRDQLGAYCEAVVLHAQAQALVRKAGPLIRDPQGNVRVNPATRVVNQATRNMLLWAREFGLTPAARVHLHAEQVADDYADVERMLS